MDLKGSGHGLILGAIPAFAWRDLGKPWKTQVRIFSILIHIQTRYPLIQLKCCATDGMCFLFISLLFITQNGSIKVVFLPLQTRN
jgi:hypothetical protein